MKVILYEIKKSDVAQKELKEIAYWYAKEFVQPDESACVLAVPYEQSDKKTLYYQGENCFDKLCFYLKTRGLDPNQCEFHFIFSAETSTKPFKDDGLGADYRDLFDKEKFKGKVYVGVRSSNGNRIISNHIPTKNHSFERGFLEGRATGDINERRELTFFQSSPPQSEVIIEWSLDKSMQEEIDALIQEKIIKLSANSLKKSSTDISDALQELRLALKDTAKHPSAVFAKWINEKKLLLAEERGWIVYFAGQVDLRKFINRLEKTYPYTLHAEVRTEHRI